MPIKLLKNENENELNIQMILHAKNYSLTIDKNKCTGCGICMEICPREAIQVTRTPKTEGKKAKKPTVEIKEQKCHYCGICEVVCPFGAMDIKVNGKSIIPVIKTESFPQLIRKIRVDETKCSLQGLDIKEPCPLGHIKLNIYDKGGKEVTDTVSVSNKKDLKIKVEIDKKSCPCCRICETKFPNGAINVEKMFYGSLKINNEKCPENCRDCIDVCPIPDVLYISDGKVQVNDSHCVYCGTCKIACPPEDALELKRTRIQHTEVHSGAWNKALEKLAVPSAITKEIENRNARKLKKAIIKRLLPEELKE